MPMGGPRGPGPGGPGGFRHGPGRPGRPGRFRHRPRWFGPPPPPPPRRFRRPRGCLGCAVFLISVLAAVGGLIAALFFLF